jgi:hypothetical protein
MRRDQHHELYRLEKGWDVAIQGDDMFDPKKYPADWPAIRERIQSRAGDRCEKCGVANGNIIFRSVDGSCWYDPSQDAHFAYPSGEALPDWHEADLRDKFTKVCCTTAHIDPATKHDKTDCRDEALAFLCQACHLAEDLQDHLANRRKTLMARKAVAVLPGLEEGL